MLANTPAMVEAHYGVPMTQGVLNTLNTRLDAAIIAFSLDHAETKVLITDREFSKTVKEALAPRQGKAAGDRLRRSGTIRARASGSARSNTRSSSRRAIPDYAWHMPDDEWDAIALNYTSGTTGDPKGVVYHHRGAYLLAMGNVITCGMQQHPVYPVDAADVPLQWLVLSLDRVDRCRHARLPAPGARPPRCSTPIATHKVTHLCGAPIVMSTLLNAADAEKKPLPHTVNFATAAAPPPEAVLAGMKERGFQRHACLRADRGLRPRRWSTNGTPPGTACRSPSRRRRNRDRACAIRCWKGLDVRDPDTLAPVPRDGETLGEVMMRGNVVMRGYLKNKKSTDAGVQGRLVPHRRSRRDVSGRLRAAQGPLQGHHHLGRGEHLLDRGRGRALQASGRAGRRRGGEAGREMGRDALCVRGAQARLAGDDRRAHRLVPQEPRRATRSRATFVFVELPKTSTGKIQKSGCARWRNKHERGRVIMTVPSSRW